MRQVLINSRGALIARMPRPSVEPGTVLVRVRYSLISTGTELASLRPSLAAADSGAPLARAQVAATYLGKALRDPGKAADRLTAIVRRTLARSLPHRPVAAQPSLELDAMVWQRCDCIEFSATAGRLRLTSDRSRFGYQAMSHAIPVSVERIPIVELAGEVAEGSICIGLLDESRSTWLGSRTYQQGPLEDRLIFSTGTSRHVTLVIANAGSEATARLELRRLTVYMAPPLEHDLPQSELDDQGWNVGYSAAGEIIAVGSAIRDLAVGDAVACAGAGKANHADYITVPRNLVCKVPPHCDLKVAASATVGTIALQGVRRAAPQLGETICVLGLGLIGQITSQLLRANGCRVLGLELDAQRVARALELGIDGAVSDPEAYRELVRDHSGGRGADRVLITAATSSDSLINLAMEVVRPKGVVVVVGDIGLHVRREQFYRKEVDLLMSTSYGPGRYDRGYEEQGLDYPYAYVRWSLNRNMQAYLALAASQRIRVGPLIDQVVPIARAPEVYRSLALAAGSAPMAVLLEYPDDTRRLPEPPEATRVTIRGHRKAPPEVLRYALVGVGAFGTSLLVPLLARRRDRFFLRAVVSRNAAVASNFARANQVEVLASDIATVLDDPEIDLVVIATRHHEHADLAVRALEAGKHVFVEKPLALTWEELQRVADWYAGSEQAPLLLVGFNRRFSPAVQMLRKALAGRRGPWVANYRLNGGYIPADHWVQGPQGGGRNIGEACHLYDVFRSLSGAPVSAVQAMSVDPGNLPYFRNDNFAATCRYADGSMGNLLYVALGPKQGLPKERLEVFCDGEAYVLDDYKSLIRAGDGAVLWQSDSADKGHFDELCAFGDAIAAGHPAPIPVQELIETSAVALEVEDLLTGKTSHELR